MATGFGLKTTGIAELDAAFKRLGSIVVRNKIIRPALTKGARVLKANLKTLIPKRSGKLKRAIDYIVTTVGGESRGRARRATGGEVMAKVGARKGKGGGHFHLVDQGTKVRRNKKGANRGRVKGAHYLERATRQSANEVQRVIAEGVADGIKREFQKRGL